MSNKEILEKAIQKAIDGGWRPIDKDFEWRVIEPSGKPLYLSVLYAIQNLKAFDGDNVANRRLEIEQIIFNHDFAKALWGDRYFNAYEDDQAVTEEFECMDAYVCDLHTGPRWKIHLQNMVVSEDPIKYLGEHLDVQKQD